MKILFKTIAILSLSILLFNCGSDGDNNDDEDKEETYFVKAKIDDVNFTSDFPITQNNTNALSITAQNSDNTVLLQIHIVDFNGSGTYTSGSNVDNENSFIILSEGTWLTDKDYGTGTITINKNGKHLTGTFSFSAFNVLSSNTKTITNGSFKVKLP